MNEYTALREKIINYLVRRGWKSKIAKSNDRKEQQTLLEHSVKCLDIMLVMVFILSHKNLMELTEEEKLTLLFAATLHDAGKEKEEWQQYLLEKNQYVDETDPDLIREILLEMTQQFDIPDLDIDLTVTLARLHMKKHRTPAEFYTGFNSNQSNHRWKLLQEIVDVVDNVASANNLLRARETLTSSILDKYFHVSYHLTIVRGVSTIILNKAAEESFIKEGWKPILYYPNGTLYVKGAIEKFQEISLAAIKEKLLELIDNMLKENKITISELIVGNVNTNFFPKPDLFDAELLEDCLNVASNRIKLKNAKDLDSYYSCQYHNAKFIFNNTKQLNLTKKACTNSKSYINDVEKKFHHHLIFNVNQLEEEKRVEYLDRIGQALPEIAIFKFFKNVMNPTKGLITKEEQEIIQKEYEDVFGEGSYTALMETGTLNRVLDMVFTVDYFRKLTETDLKNIGISEKIGKIDYLPYKKRKEILIKILVKIAKNFYNQIDEPPSQKKLKGDMAEAFLQDLIFFSKEVENIKESSEKQLKYYLNSKQNLFSDTTKDHICPICNAHFTEGNVGYSDFVNNPNSFTNRSVAYSGVNNPVICRTCYYEKILKQILLGGKAAEQIILLPNISIGYRGGQVLVEKAERLMNQAQKYMSQSSTNPDTRISLGLWEYMAGKAIQTEFEDITPEEIVDILTYQRNQDKRSKNLKNLKAELKEGFQNQLDMVNEIYQTDYSDWDQFTDDVYYNRVAGGNSFIQAIRESVLDIKEQFKVICQTPNMILIPCFNPSKRDLSPFANGKESDSNLGFKKLFLTLMLSLGLDCAVVIIEDSEVIDETIIVNQGYAYIPKIEAVRRLTGCEWLPRTELVKWFKALASVLLIKNKAEYPPRNEIYDILTCEAPGKLLRRIDQKKNYVDYRDIQFLENIKEVYQWD